MTESVQPIQGIQPVDGFGEAEQIANDYAKIAKILESLLFVAGEPAPVERLATALELDAEDVELALLLLAETLQDRGIRLQRHHDKVQQTPSILS